MNLRTRSLAIAFVAALSLSIPVSAQSSLSISGFSKPDLLAGGTIHVNGTGFTATTIVWLENERTKVKRTVALTNLSPSGFDIVVPADLSEQKYNIVANIGAVYYTAPLQLTIHQLPTIRSASLASVVPGGNITISGGGFSPRTDDNIIMFNSYNGLCLPNPPGLNAPYYNGQTGSYRAYVIAATPTELTVQAPQELLQYISVLCPVPCHITANVRGTPAQGQIDVLVGSLNFAQ